MTQSTLGEISQQDALHVLLTPFPAMVSASRLYMTG
jgi:hypothetical protein